MSEASRDWAALHAVKAAPEAPRPALHWREYLIEAWALGTFMISAGVVTTLFEYPRSPWHTAIVDPLWRRTLIGAAMGLTAMALIYSPWGRRSGAHMNPAVTLSFLRLGRTSPLDAAFYIAAQFIGGTLGVWIVLALLRSAFTAPPVSFVATVPGTAGLAVAFVAEFLISAVLMAVVLNSAASPRLARFTGVFAGLLVCLYIAFEAPLSGMSMNPARSFASALPGNVWGGFWIYLTAPILGMQLAVTVFMAMRRCVDAPCAKLRHRTDERCIHCGHEPSNTIATETPT